MQFLADSCQKIPDCALKESSIDFALLYGRKRSLAFFVFCVVSLFFVPPAFSQIKTIGEERLFCCDKAQKRETGRNAFSSILLSSGFDSNPDFASLKKSDIFQEALYSLNFALLLRENLDLALKYDMDVLNYDRLSDLSSVLNHFRLTIRKRIAGFFVGTGCDFSAVSFFHNHDGDYYFPKGFVYVRQAFFVRFYHQLLIEAGVKEYIARQALSDTISTYQGKDLNDHRQSVEYLIGATLTKNISFKLRSRFTLNDSNARYLDFYDYKFYQFIPSFVYRLSERFTILASYGFLKKAFKDRITVAADKKQKDDIYSATFGARFKVADDNSVSFDYVYRNNDSNEETAKYRESIISCGFRLNF